MNRSLLVLPLVALIHLACPAEESDDDDGGDGGPHQVDFQCASGRSLCAEECVLLDSDPRHCGECGRACPEGYVCNGSECEVVADCVADGCTGFSYCDVAEGLCRPGCVRDDQCSPFTEACDLTTHSCGCVAEHHRCSGVCVANDSVNHCGDLCTPCPTDPAGEAVCDGAVCGIDCPGEFHLCSGECVTNDSPEHCGARCEPCPTDPNGTAECVEGECRLACHADHHLCESGCVSDFSTDSCGSSCSPCPTDPNGSATCDGVACGLECLSEYLLCEGACALCPERGIDEVSCDDAACVAASCIGGYELCQGECASCPDGDGIDTYQCVGARCEIDSCHEGHWLCSDVCAACPGDAVGADSLGCEGTSCVIESCGESYELCDGVCAACPTVGVDSTTCEAGECVATSCAAAYVLRDGRCLQWTMTAVDDTEMIGRPTLTLDEDEHPHISYYREWLGELTLVYAGFDGTSWTVDVVDESDAGYGNSIGLVDDQIQIAYSRSDNTLWYATGGPGDWSLDSVTGDVTGAMSLAIGAETYLAYTHISELSDHQAAVATYDGSSWTHDYLELGEVRHGSLALNESGHPHVLFEGEFSTLELAELSGTEWLIATVPKEGASPYSLGLVVRGGETFIAYHDTLNGEVRHIFGDGDSWSEELVDSGEQLGYALSFDVDADGIPAVAYHDSFSRVFSFALRSGDSWQISTIEEGWMTVFQSSLWFDSNGIPHLAVAADDVLYYVTLR